MIDVTGALKAPAAVKPRRDRYFGGEVNDLKEFDEDEWADPDDPVFDDPGDE